MREMMTNEIIKSEIINNEKIKREIKSDIAESEKNWNKALKDEIKIEMDKGTSITNSFNIVLKFFAIFIVIASVVYCLCEIKYLKDKIASQERNSINFIANLTSLEYKFHEGTKKVSENT